jgi:hypothetical protein
MLFAVLLWRNHFFSQKFHEGTMCRILDPKNLNLPHMDVGSVYTEHTHFETVL